MKLAAIYFYNAEYYNSLRLKITKLFFSSQQLILQTLGTLIDIHKLAKGKPGLKSALGGPA